MDSSVSVYQYDHAGKFLKAAWSAKKQKNPSFSLRSWAKQMGLKEHTPLHLMLNQKRSVSKKLLPVLIKNLKLTQKEGLFLETLIELNRSKSPTQKELYLNRLRELSPKHRINVQELENFKYLSEPLHMLIREMVDLPQFKPDPDWISSRIREQVTTAQISESIGRLMQMKLLAISKNGKLQKQDSHVSSTKDIADQAIKTFHKKSLDHAKSALTEQSVHQREFNSYLLNIEKKNIPSAKKMIREFVLKFIARFEANSGTEIETYQFSSQLFELTKDCTKERRS